MRKVASLLARDLNRGRAVGVYKIGYACDPEKRMKDLECGGALGATRCRYGLSWTDEVELWQSEAWKPYCLLWIAPISVICCSSRTPLAFHPHLRAWI